MAIDREIIRIRIDNHMQTIIDTLYILEIDNNLLSIIALD